jgi:hypothetical protein
VRASEHDRYKDGASMTTAASTETVVHEIETSVSFAAAHEEFRKPFPRPTEASVVLGEALRVFEITDDGTTRYYLMHGDKEVPPSVTLAELVAHERTEGAHRELKLKLRTETVSG